MAETYKFRRDDGGWGVAPDDPVFQARNGNAKVTLAWIVPEKTEVNGQVICHTAGVMIRRRTGSAPTSENDGELVIDSNNLSGSFVDNNLTNGTTYYYRCFPYSDHQVYNRSKNSIATATPSATAKVRITFLASAAVGMQIPAKQGSVVKTATVTEKAGITTKTSKITKSNGQTVETTVVTGGGTARIAEFELETTGIWNIGGRDVSISEIGEEIELDGHMFAFHYSENDSNPDSVTYPAGYDNSGFTDPMYVDLSTGVPHYGDWNPKGIASFIYPKSCMLKYSGDVDYYLNENDETKKADGTASDVSNMSYAGNAMMEWGQDDAILSWKIIPDADSKGFTFVIANMVVGDLKPYNHYDLNGNVSKHFYTAKYFGASDGTRLRSMSAGSIYVNNTRNSEVSLALKNNLDSSKPIWYTEVLADRMLLIMLCWLFGKSLNAQKVFGYGRCASGNNSAIGIGTMNGKGMFWGSNNQTSGSKLFGMENPYGNLWRGTAGLINSNGKILYKMTYGTQDGSTGIGYNFDGSGYKQMPGTIAGTSGGYISHMGIAEDAVLPVTISGSDSTYYTDGTWFNNGQVDYALFGGSWDSSLHVGPACCSLGSAASRAGSSWGAAVSCKPLVS